MSVRLGDLAQSQKMTTSLLALRTQVNDTQATISSGKKSSNLAGYGTSASTILALRIQNTRTSSYVEENTIVQSRLETMDSAMQTIGDVASQLQTLIAGRRSAGVDNAATFDKSVDLMLQSVQAALNTQYDGGYVFAGSRTDAAPVAFGNPASNGAGDTSYYQGDGKLASVKADDQTTITYGITADNPAFAALIAALSAAKAANASGSDIELADASAQSEAAVSNIADLRAGSGVTAGSLETINDTLQMNKLYFSNLSSDLEDTDISVAMAKVSADSVALQAAYSAMSKINSLSLTDYMR
ncbi:flagellar hook-associated protein 3 FlgL [Arboricoccus pini]|uniref:Flagellin n=1 Tax=Arboricoccus pini TaxID=1963835 RepID=A0A212QQY7_9PROT|nr:flagellin [Arboricoccus pini]SNB61753.1 flagellar hook-associated protein 3 FlgL [Arboricoccus pini]